MNDSSQSSSTPNKYVGFREGDYFEVLNKRINTLIVSAENFIVFLDDDFYVEWAEHHPISYPPKYAEIMNRVAYLETISTTHFAGTTNDKERRELTEFRRLLGEGVARLLDGDDKAAVQIIDIAEKVLTDRSLQRARIWYLGSAACLAGAIALVCILLWYMRVNARVVIGSNAFDVLLCAGAGAAGALISIIMRVREVSLNASAGYLLHYFEGCARVVVGVLGAFLVALAIKANLLVGAITRFDTPILAFASMATICFVAGASERIVPNLIRRIETGTSADNTHQNSNPTRKSG